VNDSLNTNNVCGLDIGSNTFSFAEINFSGGHVNIVRDFSVPTRLSEDLKLGGELKPQAVKRGLLTLEKIYSDFNLEKKRIITVATAVLRNTSNPEVFIEPATKILHQKIEILSGADEAMYTNRGAIVGIETKEPWIIVDIGGQSTELSWIESNKQKTISLEFGVVNLTEHFIKNDPPKSDEILALCREIRLTLSKKITNNLKGNILGVAGTATTLGLVNAGIKEWKRDKVHGQLIDKETVKKWTKNIAMATIEERTKRYGVRPGRADVFATGLCILDEIMSYLKRDSFTISANGLRIGIALSLLD